MFVQVIWKQFSWWGTLWISGPGSVAIVRDMRSVMRMLIVKNEVSNASERYYWDVIAS